MAVAPDYCQLGDVLSRLYTGQGAVGGSAPPADPSRDAELSQLITQYSRRFDGELDDVNPNPGTFAPQYDVRLFQGNGSQILDVEPFASVVKVEYNATPGAAVATWLDITSEMSNNLMGAQPLRGYPKTRLFRQYSFFQDPYTLGNIRLACVYGIVLPDPSATQPSNPWQGINPALYAPPAGGWWVTPPDVVDAVAYWVSYAYQSTRAGYEDLGGTAAANGGLRLGKGIPPPVWATIQNYMRLKTPRFALVNNDGTVRDGRSAGEAMGPSRWSGWYTR